MSESSSSKISSKSDFELTKTKKSVQKVNHKFRDKTKSEKFEDNGESCKSWGKFYNVNKDETVLAPMQITKDDAQFKLILP